ncbi:MAG: HDOD domain-containing protein [Dehalococcoidia bacterium]
MSTTDPVDFGAQNRLRNIVNRTTELAPLKPVAARAISLAEDERSSTMDLAAVISADPALTARLLRLSNSAYYGYARRISTVREAVVLLGTKTVRSVAIAAGVMDALKVPDMPGFSRDLFWAHNVTVGLVAEAIARATRIARPEDAFTAGVIHDVGKLAMMLVEPDLFRDTVELVTHEGRTFREAELHTFGVTHEAIGARLAHRWKFPDALATAIRGHHAPLRGDELHGLDELLHAADLACNRVGMAAGFDWVKLPERHCQDPLPRQAEEALTRVHGGLATLQEKARAFLIHVSARPPQWYAIPRDEPEPLVDRKAGEAELNVA